MVRPSANPWLGAESGSVAARCAGSALCFDNMNISPLRLVAMHLITSDRRGCACLLAHVHPCGARAHEFICPLGAAAWLHLVAAQTTRAHEWMHAYAFMFAGRRAGPSR